MTQPSRSLRVLVVDDDPVLIDLIPWLLNVLGHTVDTANTGALALQRIATAIPPDVVLIDLRMPDMDGATLAAAIAALPHAPHLIGMSGSEPTLDQSALFDAFLRKPFGIEGLQNCLETGLQHPPPPIPPTVPAPVVLDTAVYHRLAASMAATQLQQLYQRTLDYVRKTAPAFDQASPQTRRELAHSLHGSCAMVGAMELATFAASIERHPAIQNSSPGAPLESSNSYKILRAADRLESMVKELHPV